MSQTPIRYCHKKRGSHYDIAAVATLQVEPGTILKDGDKIVVYLGVEDPAWWGREEHEFHDGRFEVADQQPIKDGPFKTDILGLANRLRIQAQTRSKLDKEVQEAKSLRQSDNPEGRTDLYSYQTPEQTLEWQAADAIIELMWAATPPLPKPPVVALEEKQCCGEYIAGRRCPVCPERPVIEAMMPDSGLKEPVRELNETFDGFQMLRDKFAKPAEESQTNREIITEAYQIESSDESILTAQMMKDSVIKLVTSHLDRVLPHDPDQPGEDLVAYGYGNACLNLLKAVASIPVKQDRVTVESSEDDGNSQSKWTTPIIDSIYTYMDTMGVPRCEFDPSFVVKMVSAMMVSFHKYGYVGKVYGGIKLDATADVRTRMGRYRETANKSFLVDAANFAMIESMHPDPKRGANWGENSAAHSPGRSAIAGRKLVQEDNEGNRIIGETILRDQE